MTKPTMIDRFKLAVQVYRSGMPRQLKKSPVVWPEWRVGQPQWHIMDLDSYIGEGFNANSLIYSAIMYKAKAISSIPLRAYTGDTDNPDMISESAPLAKLVARPNPSQSWREFQMLQTVWLNLAGNAYTYFDRPARDGLPVAMYALNPMRVYIVPGKQGGLAGFLYVPENKAMTDGIPLLPEDVSHVKFPNPGDPLDGMGYGLSPLSPMAKSADVDNSVTSFLKIFFERGTMVAGLLKFDVPLDNNTVDRVRARWKEIYGGYENWDEIGVLDQGGSYEKLGYSFEEMGFADIDERNESRILGPFGVPPILIGTRMGLARSTYSNYEQAYQAFWQDTMLHEAKLFEDDYQYYLSDGNVWVAFDFSNVPAFQQDIPTMVQSWAQLVQLGVPKNTASEVVGLEIGDLPDGDVAYMPLSLVPIDQAQAQREANTEAMTTQPEMPANDESEGNDEEAPENAVEDERTDKMAILDRDIQEFIDWTNNIKIAKGLPTRDVKKNHGRQHRSAASGRHTTPLVGVGNAASRLAQNKRLNKTGEKS